MKILDFVMWLMFVVSSILSILTMLVAFGMVYTKQLSTFANFLPLEISLAITLFLWGISSLYNTYTKNGRKTFFYSVIMGGILLVFIVLGVY